MERLRKRTEEYCEKGVPAKAWLLELGWMMEEVVVSYLVYVRYRERGSHVEDNWGQGVIPSWRWKKLSWCGYKEETKEKAAWPREAKAQQSGTWTGDLESTAKEGGNQREVRRTFGMLREVWLNIGVEKIDMHEGIIIKALLNSGTTGMFMDKRTVAKHGFNL